MVNVAKQINKDAYYMGNIRVGKKEVVKRLLENLRVSYYIPSEDFTLSYSFKYVFRLPTFVNLIFIKASFNEITDLQERRIPVNFYLDSAGTPIGGKQYELFYFVIHRETLGIILDGEGVKNGKKTRIRVKEGVFKGFEGVLPVEPEDGYALVLEIPPLISWQIPVDKHDIEIISHRAYSSVKY